MKLIVVLSLILGAAPVLAETMYIVDGSVADGLKSSYGYVVGWSSVETISVFGMNLPADRTLAALDPSKAYRCDVDGSKATIKLNLLPYSGRVSVFKIYGIGSCVEVQLGEAVKAVREKDEVERASRR